MAFPGIKVLACVNSEKRGPCELNGEPRWCVRPSMNCCRCTYCYFPKTRKVRDCDAVGNFLHDISFPKVTSKDHLYESATEIVILLSQPSFPATLPL